jgi:hypothetical protein
MNEITNCIGPIKYIYIIDTYYIYILNSIHKINIIKTKFRQCFHSSRKCNSEWKLRTICTTLKESDTYYKMYFHIL